MSAVRRLMRVQAEDAALVLGAIGALVVAFAQGLIP